MALIPISFIGIARLSYKFVWTQRALALLCQNLAATSAVPSANLTHKRLRRWDFNLRPWRPLLRRITRHARGIYREVVPRAFVIARGLFAVAAWEGMTR